MNEISEELHRRGQGSNPGLLGERRVSYPLDYGRWLIIVMLFGRLYTSVSDLDAKYVWNTDARWRCMLFNHIHMAQKNSDLRDYIF